MASQKSAIDEKNDIEIKINSSESSVGSATYKEYSVLFSHKNPQIIDKDDISRKEFVALINIQKSPSQDLNDFIDTLDSNNINNSIQIDSAYFDELNKYSENTDLNLSKIGHNLTSHLEASVRAGLLFTSLPEAGKKGVQISPKEIISKNSTSIQVNYKFKFNKLGKTGLLHKIITFTKQ